MGNVSLRTHISISAEAEDLFATVTITWSRANWCSPCRAVVSSLTQRGRSAFHGCPSAMGAEALKRVRNCCTSGG